MYGKKIVESVVMGEGASFKNAMMTFNKTRPPVAAGAVVLAKRAFYEATNYLLQRTKFGVPIAQHQAVSSILADMAIGVETRRLSWMRAAWEVNNGAQNRSYHASVAKCYASDMCNRVASDACFNSEYLRGYVPNPKTYHWKVVNYRSNAPPA